MAIPLNPQLLQILMGQMPPTAPLDPMATPAPQAPTPTPGLSPTMPGQDPMADILAGRLAQPEPLSRGQKVGLGLADAINTYLTLRRGAPRQSSAVEAALARRQAAADRKNRELYGRAQIQASQKEAQQQAEERAADVKFREEERAARIAAGEDERAIDRERIAAETEDSKRRIAYEEARDRLNRSLEERMSTLEREGNAPDKVLARQVAGEQREALKQAKASIVAMKQKVKEQLAAGRSPAEIREEIMDELDVLGLTDEARQDAENFMELKLGQLLTVAQQNAPQPSVSTRPDFGNPLTMAVEALASRGMFTPTTATPSASNPLLDMLMIQPGGTPTPFPRR